MLAMKGHHLDEASGAGPGRGFEASARKRRLPGSLRAAGFAILGMVLVFVGGFALFATHVSRLSTPEDPPVADAIIVLTGGQARLDAAIGLLKLGKGERLLISGVHPSTSSGMLQAATGGDKALFSCCVDIDRAALDTVGNAEESVTWVRTHAYGRVILVTNNSHMPRSLLELGRLLDREELEPYPVVNANLENGGWMVRPDALRVLFTEYNKYLVALARGVVPSHPADSVPVINASAAAQSQQN
jgi:uncharacterized SAM-binding protein YcdF (DUF218 family)